MMNIRNIDLNLLVVLRELLQEKSTVKVAAKLGMSQPAVSHALNRLRETFGDPLLVRASKGMVPTRRALELARPVSLFLDEVATLFTGEKTFVPAEAKVTFKIAATDFFEQVFLSKILAVFEKEAPNCKLITRAAPGTLPKEQLESGEFDLAVAGFYGDLPEGYYQQVLFQDDFVCVARKNHPSLKGALTIKKYADETHMLISPHGDMKARSEVVLKKKGLEQKFMAGVASFTSPGWIIPNTDLLLTCPRRLALTYAEYLPVKVHELPFDNGKISVMQIWHERSHSDEAHKWLRQVIFQVCKSL
ncbi:MAG TPA: LysR family transcriptional regulator [Bacteriovoracaceae bacterium]|nr:LysR family transcriptional regulator [Bacteriovoracaceae bacterium]